MNLLAADLERFSRRRLMRGALILALFLIAVIVAIQTVRGHRFTENLSYGGGFYVGPDGQTLPDPTGTFQVVHDTRVNVAQLSNVLVAVGLIMACVSFVLGASFVGAEFGGSGLSTQLLFEPRRWRVHVSKATACAISCAAMTCCVLCTLALAIFVGAKVHGVAQGLDSTFWQERAREIGRGVIGAGLAGSMAYTVAVALRRTRGGDRRLPLADPARGDVAATGRVAGNDRPRAAVLRVAGLRFGS